MNKLLVILTTVSSRDTAKLLSENAVRSRVAICAQVSSAIESFYEWEGKVQHDEEFRITFKVLPEKLDAITAFVNRHHPYKTKQWIVLEGTAAQDYLDWGRATAMLPPAAGTDDS
eukprot:comp15109_c0_seq1/m.22551 comp15109_c0_seq1/g.22551  ORF comp15109_c0_seq1/g.22551 comp15109_c0_seq1/m.22551 type:complete len:115 (-) comp15109_c0_seq1:12-356(-)